MGTMIPWQFWLLLGMCIAAVIVGALAMKYAPVIPDDEDWKEIAQQDKLWKKKRKDFDQWKK